MYLVGPLLVREMAGSPTTKEDLMSVPPWPTESHEVDILEDGAPADRVASLRARRASRSYTVAALILAAGSLVLILTLAL